MFYHVNVHTGDDELPLSLLSSTDIRNSMNRLPRWCQPYLTWLTTQTIRDQKPIYHSVTYQLITSIFSLNDLQAFSSDERSVVASLQYLQIMGVKD